MQGPAFISREFMAIWGNSGVVGKISFKKPQKQVAHSNYFEFVLNDAPILLNHLLLVLEYLHYCK